ncbi:MAG: hypothetical protein IJ817_00720 [Clostridia bacterium]|nr:hypothetical protein [Clostridia bacterium]
MKDFLDKVRHSPMILAFFAIAIFFGMPALARASQVDEYSIVIGVGIDKGESAAYDVSFLTFVPIPDQNFTERYKVASSSGESIAKAVNDAELYLGKEIRFAHIKTVVLSMELLDEGEDVSKLLDFLVRENDITASTKIVTTKTKAKEFLDSAKALDSESSTKISQIVSYNRDSLYSVDTSFESFYKSFFGPTKTGLVPIFDLQKDYGITPTSEESGQSSQSGASKPSGEEKKLITNTGKIVVLRNGRKETELSSDELKNINLISGDFTTGFITIKDFDGRLYHGHDLTFEIFGKKVRFDAEFQNGVPVVSIYLKLDLLLSEVLSDEGMVEKNTDFEKFGKDDLAVVANGVRKQMSGAMEVMREKKIDLLNFYTKIYNADRNKFEQYLSEKTEADFYLDGVVVKANVDIKLR